MPRYFFHRTNGGFAPDTEGSDLPDLAAARAEAVVYAAETVRHRPNYVWDGRDFRVEVTDEAGTLLYTVLVRGIEGPAARGA